MSPNPPKQSEASVQEGIKALLLSQGGRPVRQVAGAIRRGNQIVAYTEPGISDLICCVPYSLKELEAMGLQKIGVFCAVETKAGGWRRPGPKAKARKHYEQQERFIRQIKLSGGFGIFATSIDDAINGLNLNSRFLF